MTYLVVVAHPDDEVLGAGATIYKLSQRGHKVDVCILSGKVGARSNRPCEEELEENIKSCAGILGINSIIQGGFPNIEFNTVPHLNIVQFIEEAIVKTGADKVFTHHPLDVNNDHMHTALACQAAIRLFQRKSEIKPIKELLYMEVPSSTEWNVNGNINSFVPNTFFEAGIEGIDKKLEALSQYKGVMRDYPHPRSKEAITGLAAYRGSQSGLYYAEAFESVFKREAWD